MTARCARATPHFPPHGMVPRTAAGAAAAAACSSSSRLQPAAAACSAACSLQQQPAQQPAACSLQQEQQPTAAACSSSILENHWKSMMVFETPIDNQHNSMINQWHSIETCGTKSNSWTNNRHWWPHQWECKRRTKVIENQEKTYQYNGNNGNTIITSNIFKNVRTTIKKHLWHSIEISMKQQWKGTEKDIQSNIETLKQHSNQHQK